MSNTIDTFGNITLWLHGFAGYPRILVTLDRPSIFIK